MHCYVTSGSPGYSEYTPSSPFDFFCQKSHKFTFEAHNYNNKADLLADIRKAETCADFKEEKQS